MNETKKIKRTMILPGKKKYELVCSKWGKINPFNLFDTQDNDIQKRKVDLILMLWMIVLN